MVGGCAIYGIRCLLKKNTEYWDSVLEFLESFRVNRNMGEFYAKVQKAGIEWEDIRINLLKLKFIENPIPTICPNPANIEFTSQQPQV